MSENPEIQTTGKSALETTPKSKEAPEAIKAAQKKGQQMIEHALPDKQEKPKQQEWSAQKFENEIQRLQKENSQSLTSFAEKHSELLKTIGIDTALKVLEAAAKRPFAKDTLLFFAAKEPTITIADTCESASISKQPYYNEILDMAIRSRPSMIFEFTDVYEEGGFDVQKLLLKGADEDPWGFTENFQDLKAYLTGKAEVFLAQQKERIKIAERGRTLPQKTIEETDFPLLRKDFEMYLLELNKEATFIDILKEPGSKDVFFSAPFESFLKTQTGKINFMNAFSLAQSIRRELSLANQPVNDENIGAQLNKIPARLKKAMAREVIGPGTKLILFTHEEGTFQNDEILEKLYQRNGGKSKNILMSGKGLEMKDGKNQTKERLLKTIRDAKEGRTTILFSGHGFSENWSFSTDHHPEIDRSLENHPHNLSYRELADALIDSGNIENINLIGACCYSYDFFRNLFDYLASIGVQKRPALCISFANKGKPSLGMGEEMQDPILDAIYSLTEKDQPVQGKHFLEAEGLPAIWKNNDPAIFSNGTEIM